jgi:lipoprotein-anchoring transpeptidase ErfK/SrfK
MAYAHRFDRFRRPVISILLASALSATAALPAAAKVVISVNKATQLMSVAVDGKPQWSWPVSTGLAKHETPSGAFTPFRLEADHRSREWDDAPMPHAIFFTKTGHAIHGSLEEKRLGRRASHGCVRISRHNAAKLFALVRTHGLGNTRVSVFTEQMQVAAPLSALSLVSTDVDPAALALTIQSPASQLHLPR